MQSLFEWEFRDGDAETILHRDLSLFAEKVSNHDFARLLLEGVKTHLPEIRKTIEQYAPEWPINQINPVDRVILYIAIFEMLYANEPDVPPAVVINEAVEIAKEFGGDKSGSFVNGVLSSILKSQVLQ